MHARQLMACACTTAAVTATTCYLAFRYYHQPTQTKHNILCDGKGKDDDEEQIVLHESEDTILKLTPRKIDDERINNMVVSECCGAIATFVGTTRDNFDGKQVTMLSYEAYAPMAMKQLSLISKEIRNRWAVKKIAILHRLGVCPIGEASVMIAVSSPHRKAALEACHWAIDTLKAKVPIWKKEHYKDGSTWKQNKEFDPATLVGRK
uniref:Molybdopterin synthase catalytic subunit n=1 Tax=Lotharella globosa TaxID=91324 RepID=A0A7S3ZIS3_9EUKA